MSDQGRYRKVYVRLWRHPGFAELTDSEKSLALYVLTGPQTNRLGLYVLSIATAAEDLGTVPETLKRRLVNVCQTFGWLFDARARVVYVPSHWKWNPPENVNVMKGNLKDLNEIPPCGLVDAFARNIETLSETLRETFHEGLRQRLPKLSPNQEPYPYPDPKQKQEKAALRAGAKTENPQIPSGHADVRMMAIARKVSSEAPNASIDYLVDAFQEQCRLANIATNRASAVVALTASR